MTAATRRQALPGVTLSALFVAAIGLAAPARAQESGATLAKLARSGVITLGVRDGAVPFSFLDEQGHDVGYTLDLCDQIVISLRKQLHLPKLKAVLMPLTVANRFRLVIDGSVDLECGATTNDVERQRQVAFSPTMFVISARLLSKKVDHIRSLADLRGKTLVAVAGTSTLVQITRLNQQRQLGMTILLAKDNPDAFRMLEQGQALAEVNDDILLAAQAANANNPAAYVIGGEAMSVEPYGIMLRKGDPAFKRAVDTALVALYKSGAIHAIYAKWFTQPIPGNGINLNFPMPAALRSVIARPTDSGVASVYTVKPAGKGAGDATLSAN